MTDTATVFAARLLSLRQARGLTQQQLADAAGVARATINRFEQGRREPAWRTVCALADALRVPIARFRD